MACTRRSRGCDLGRSQAARCASSALCAAYLCMPTTAGTPSGATVYMRPAASGRRFQGIVCRWWVVCGFWPSLPGPTAGAPRHPQRVFGVVDHIAPQVGTRPTQHKGCRLSITVVLPRPLAQAIATSVASPASASMSSRSVSRLRPLLMPLKPVSIDLALHLVSEHCGPMVAARVAQRLAVALRRGPEDPQLSPFLAHRQHLNARLHRVQCSSIRSISWCA